jgi:hypothetical protein
MTVEQISNQMEVGQFYRNGAGRLFCIMSLDETQVVYAEYEPSGPKDKRLAMSRSTFAALVRNHHMGKTNAVLDSKTGRWRETTDIVLERAYEFTRNMKK